MDWHILLNDALKALAIAAVPWLLAQVKPLITAAFDYIEAHTSAAWTRQLEAEAETIVLTLWETFSKGIKTDLADGKITAEEAKARLTEVGQLARKELGAWLSKMPERFRPQVEQRVGVALEAALARLKIVKGIPPQSPSQPPAASPSR